MSFSKISHNAIENIGQTGTKIQTKYISATDLKLGYCGTEAVLFMGLVPDNAKLYNSLQSMGYHISFKPTVVGKEGRTKGNVDGELILFIARDFYENKLERAVLVSGDGDYHCIVEFLKEKKIPVFIISPNRKYLSLLLKRTNVPIIILDDFMKKLQKK